MGYGIHDEMSTLCEREGANWYLVAKILDGCRGVAMIVGCYFRIWRETRTKSTQARASGRRRPAETKRAKPLSSCSTRGHAMMNPLDET